MSLKDFDLNSWKDYFQDPLPGWANSSSTLFDVPKIAIHDENKNGVESVCFSVPFDGTASSRPGAKFGPASIREASRIFANQTNSRGHLLLRNMRNGFLYETVSPNMADAGDLHVYSSNVTKQMEALSAEAFVLASKYKKLIFLGGEHSLSFPVFRAMHKYCTETQNESIGYVQVDHHFDFGNNSSIHGLYYHGSNARRISELPGMSIEKMAFVGVGDFTSASQFDHLTQNKARIKSIQEIREKGFIRCLKDSLDGMTELVDHIYLSIDIDVCDTGTATGTGHVTVGGINATEFLDIASLLHSYPIRVLDLMEVAPVYDQSNATSHLAARLLYEWLFTKPVKIENQNV
ncbi:arginase family protein [Leptospira sp. 201903071]|uniref:arginase family protein n=1 Tax=Leptospira ainazelensis TaxID=2810034 RepID=UPI001963EB82|nr:arginase family protein [Leptospira ainazelensis]MBM9502384.1 arginase family protein [Leptospira ainazelensis]